MTHHQNHRILGPVLTVAMVALSPAVAAHAYVPDAAAPTEPAAAAPGLAHGHRVQQNRMIARELVMRRWQSSRQYRCLDLLWTRESNWNHRAGNPRTGAYGIPQALPGGKMSRSGADWRTNPRTQIRWGLRYIQNRYGTPCRAWRHFRAFSWY